MQPTKYRGLRKDNAEWVEGCLIIENPPLQCFANENKDADKYLIGNSGFADWNMPRPFNAAEVIPETVGLYTGHKDKFGTKVFGDDLLKSPDPDFVYCLVEWDTKSACFIINGYFKPVVKEGGSECSDDLEVEPHVLLFGVDELEVIGNIHQHPHLLNP